MNGKQVVWEHNIKIMICIHFKGKSPTLVVAHDFVFVYWKSYLLSQTVIRKSIARGTP